MAQDSALHLIIIDDSADEAAAIGRSLRSLGYAVKPAHVQDLEGFSAALQGGEQDLVLCHIKAKRLPLAKVAKQLSNLHPPLPLIAVCNDGTTPDQAIAEGATDLVKLDNAEHLTQVVARELQNIRQLRQLEALTTSYLDSEKRCQVLMESSRDAIAYIHEGMHVYANMQYLVLFGYEDFSEVEGTPIMDMVGAENQGKLKEFLREQAKNPDTAPDKLETSLKHANGSAFKGQMEFSRATIDGEACTQIVMRDQTNTKELEKQLTALSQIDPITGVYNRQYLFATLHAACENVKNSEHVYSLWAIQLDNFDEVKSSVGVLAADEVIKQYAELIKKIAPKGDVLARHEGSEFLLLCSISQEEHIEKLAKAFLVNIEKIKLKVDGTVVNFTCSIGVCVIDQSTSDANEAFSRTERALLSVQEEEGNNYSVFVPKEGEKSQKQIDTEWTKRFEKALQQNHLRLFFQPIVSLTGDPMHRFEVSVRMQVDDKEMTEDEFIPIADRIDMLTAVDRWVILNTLKKLVVRLKAHPDTIFFVRLSHGALSDGELFRWINERIKSLKLPHGSLVFQFNEADALTHLKQARAFSFALHKINCKIALDNFGNGPNPFQLLKHVPADYLRVNREFMVGLGQNPKNQEAIKNIAAKAKEFGKPTIAPCVEEAASLSVLWGLGTDLIQGGFLQEPKEDLNYDFSSMMG